MNISRRMVFTSIPLSLLFASSLQAKPRHAKVRHAKAKSSWEGTWSGSWGGSRPTSITIAGSRVVSYQYGGQTFPVDKSRISPTKIVYEASGNTVTLTRTGATTASAALHGSQGDATADLTKQ